MTKANHGGDPAALMHLDGCHFYVWVTKAGHLTFDERQDDNLRIWSRRADNRDEHNSEPCERCEALLNGAEPRHETREINVPTDSKEAFFAVVAAVGEIDEGGSHELDSITF